jgi:hypothetical protein
VSAAKINTDINKHNGMKTPKKSRSYLIFKCRHHYYSRNAFNSYFISKGDQLKYYEAKRKFKPMNHKVHENNIYNLHFYFDVVLTVHRRYYVEIKCQLDATDEFFITDLIACSTCFGHLYAHHQEL